MERANQIQIGMLGVIILLLLIQLAMGAFGGASSNNSSSSSARDQARNNIASTNSLAANPASTPAATPAAQQNQPAVPTGPTTNMTFAEKSYDFGTIDEGEKVKHVFKFTNTGKEDLVISNARGSCGCTVPNWPKEPIAPGKTGEIEVQFDSKGKKGKRNQSVTITANTEPASTVINLTGEVTPDPNAPATPAAQPAGQPNIQLNTGK